MPDIQLIDITKRFGNVTANDSVSIDIRADEIHSLLGENGAGKTTLMNILYGLYKPDSGHIVIDGAPGQHRQSTAGDRARHRHGASAFHAGAFIDDRRELRDRADGQSSKHFRSCDFERKVIVRFGTHWIAVEPPGRWWPIYRSDSNSGWRSFVRWAAERSCSYSGRTDGRPHAAGIRTN